MTVLEPFSLAYQILQECPFHCDICHRRYRERERRLSPVERERMVDVLKEVGLSRLTITGGEPTVLGEELFEFLKYVHQKQIHVCLSTTGYKLDRARIEEMDEYLDQLLIPIRSLTRTSWLIDFGDTSRSIELFETANRLIQEVKTTGIILEVSTVVHRENIKRIIDLGWQLVSLNPNIVWRIEEYYSMGIRSELRTRFEIEDQEFELLCDQVNRTFGSMFRYIAFSRKRDRVRAPDFFITPTGELVTTSGNHYGDSVGNVLLSKIPTDFKMRRSWSEYRRVCRDWGWGDL